eukprot:scaffold253773_cov19-Tisochrysis_lutea.AAC.2
MAKVVGFLPEPRISKVRSPLFPDFLLSRFQASRTCTRRPLTFPWSRVCIASMYCKLLRAPVYFASVHCECALQVPPGICMCRKAPQPLFRGRSRGAAQRSLTCIAFSFHSYPLTGRSWQRSRDQSDV